MTTLTPEQIREEALAVAEFAETHSAFHDQDHVLSGMFTGQRVGAARPNRNDLPGTACLAGIAALLFAPEETLMYQGLLRFPGEETFTEPLAWVGERWGMSEDDIGWVFFHLDSDVEAVARLRAWVGGAREHDPELTEKYRLFVAWHEDDNDPRTWLPSSAAQEGM